MHNCDSPYYRLPSEVIDAIATDYSMLPLEHYRKHHCLLALNDKLVSILQYVDENNISNVTIKFKNTADADVYKRLLPETVRQGWLVENGYKEKMYEAYTRHTFFSLLADFLNYMFESISCAAKGKIAVAYALLRKPLKDTLGMVEWLYLDSEEVVSLLLDGPMRDLEITKEIAKANSEEIENRYGFHNYFSYRYEKQDEHSLEKLWHKANHLITANRYNKSEVGELNFVFAYDEVHRDLLDYYYTIVPLIMLYATQLVFLAFERFSDMTGYTCYWNEMCCILQASAWLTVESYDSITDEYINNGIPFHCPICGTPQELTNTIIENIIQGMVKCPVCCKETVTFPYMFDWEENKFSGAGHPDSAHRSQRNVSVTVQQSPANTQQHGKDVVYQKHDEEKQRYFQTIRGNNAQEREGRAREQAFARI